VGCQGSPARVESHAMSGKPKANLSPRIQNRRALHEYFIEARLECGIALQGSEVKSLRAGLAQLQDAYARIERGTLTLYQCYIDPYTKSALAYNHEPTRPRRLLAHRREIKKLENETTKKGTTLIPLAIYFKEGRAKVEIGVARGKQHHDKRDTIRKKEMDRDMRRAMSQRQ
jgi:SsrA-binding protein